MTSHHDTQIRPGGDVRGGPEVWDAADVPDVRDMAIVHQFFRRELRLAPNLLASLRDDEHERREALGWWLDQIATGVHHHHQGEDRDVFPLLVERAGEPALMAQMEAQHEAVAAGTDAVEARLRDWSLDPDPTSTRALIEAYEQLLPPITRHLEDEERMVVPLIARYLTGAEYGRGAKSGNGKFDPRPLMMAFGGMVEECSPADAAWMIGHLTPQVQQAWYATGHDDYVALMTLLRGE